MVVDRNKFLLLAAALGTMHDSEGLARESPSPGAADAAPGVSRPFCDEIAKENDRLLGAPSGYCDGYTVLGFGAQAVEAIRADVAAQRKEPLWHYCHVGHGDWAIRLVSIGLSTMGGEAISCGWSAAYELVHEDRPGAAVRSRARSALREYISSIDENTSITHEIAFDYDGDGQDELILATHTWVNGEGTTSQVEVLRAHGREVGPYPVGFAYDGVADADGDDRPDLIFARQFVTGSFECRGPGMHQEFGVPLLVHSLPDGTFSMSDATARRWAFAECPSKNAREGCLSRASCLRLWGEDAAAIDGWAEKEPSCKSPCQDWHVGTAIAAQALPLATLDHDPLPPLPSVKPLVAAPEGE
jgi:hypothetical protein